MSTITTKPKRTRIAHGILVYSTNELQNACAKAITIVHRYNYLNNKRIKRFVINT